MKATTDLMSCQKHRLVKNPYTKELVCAHCGLIFGQTYVPPEPKREVYSDAWSFTKQSYDNIGSTITLTKKGITKETRQWLRRIACLSARLRPCQERRLYSLIADLELVSSYMELSPSIRADIQKAIKKLYPFTRGYPRLRALAIVTYLACRRRAPRTTTEVDKAFTEVFGDEYIRVRGLWPVFLEKNEYPSKSEQERVQLFADLIGVKLG